MAKAKAAGSSQKVSFGKRLKVNLKRVTDLKIKNQKSIEVKEDNETIKNHIRRSNWI